jgi:hypothetical protein
MKILNKLKFIALFLIIAMQFVFMLSVHKAYAAQLTVNLGTAANFAVLAGTPLISDAGSASLITGNVGMSPAASSAIGLECTQVTGTIYAIDSTGKSCFTVNAPLVVTAKSDLDAAYLDAAGRTPVNTINTELGGQTLVPGVYASGATTMGITAGAGPLVLDGQGDPSSVFIFEVSADAPGLTVGPGSTVSLINGACAGNVFWRVNTATINTTAVFKGNILALNSITVANGANIEGRLLARNGQVTLSGDTIKVPAVCAATTSSSSSSPSTGTSECIASEITTVPVIIESRRVSPTSIFISWGPYAGINTFNVEYGLTSGSRPYNVSVTGFSTTINGLPANQPIWVQVSATNNCAIGTYGPSVLVGGPSLPNTGFAPHNNNIPWYIPAGIGVAMLTLLFSIQRKYKFSSKS